MLSRIRGQKILLDKTTSGRIVEAIRHAERQTSGEIRVFVEKHCRYMDALDRAAELFYGLAMDRTQNRNAVLLYVALADHQLAVFADESIHREAGQTFWNNLVNEMISRISKDQLAEGIIVTIDHIGETLQKYFPWQKDTDKNELPDSIVFGN